MVAAGLCRRTIHIRLGKIKRVFRWAVSEELVPADIYQRRQAVAPLRPGRDGVRESEPVEPVPAEQNDAALPHMQPTIHVLVEFPQPTACRPAGVLGLTTWTIDRSVETWIYRPAHLEGEWRGRDRQIVIGPLGLAWHRTLLEEEIRAILQPDVTGQQIQAATRRLLSPAAWSVRSFGKFRTPTRSPLCGQRPPIGSSTASSRFAGGRPTQDTSTGPPIRPAGLSCLGLRLNRRTAIFSLISTGDTRPCTPDGYILSSTLATRKLKRKSNLLLFF